MSTKVKGLLKGLRYISQIFDEDKESKMEIGYPTDVKHVAHIGWDGPSVDSPSWMKDFKSNEGGCQSTPLSVGDKKENPEVKWVSEDSSQRSSNAIAKDLLELSKSTRRSSSTENSLGTDSPRKEKSRHSRRHHSKGSSESIKAHQQLHDETAGSDTSSRSLPDIPKKSRRKKSKDFVGEGSSRKHKGKSSSICSSQSSNLGPDNDFFMRSQDSEPCQTSSSKHLGQDNDSFVRSHDSKPCETSSSKHLGQNEKEISGIS